MDTMETPPPRPGPMPGGDGRRRCGRYELMEELGSGSFGSVFKAWDPHLERQVAVKLLTKLTGNARSRFAREIQATAKLQHPNIISVLDHGEERGWPFLVMELVQGRSLEDVAVRSKPTVRKAVELVLQVCLGVQHAHDAGVLHRDLKPENVLIDKTGQARVVDFGLARLGDTRSELTRSGTTLGTPYYMAPEQASAEHGSVGPRSDVYSLGGILCCVLTGRPPLEATTEQEMWMSLFRKKPDPPSKRRPEIPPELDRICLKCLEKAPEQRYGSAAELATELTHFLDGVDAGGGGGAPVPLIAGVVGAVLLALAIGLGIAAAGGNGEDPPPPPDIIDPPPVDPPPVDPPPVGPVAFGTLSIETTPDNATVELTREGQATVVGHTTFSESIAAGRWDVIVRRPGWLTYRETIEVLEDAEVHLSLALAKRELWRLNLEGVDRAVAADVDGNGIDDVVLGTQAGRLVPVTVAAQAAQRWPATDGYLGGLKVAELAWAHDLVVVHSQRLVRGVTNMGNVLWTYTAQDVLSMPTIADVAGDASPEVLIPDGGRVVCLDASSGKAVWTAAGRAPLHVVPRSSGQGPSVVLARRGQLACVSGDQGATIWSGRIGADPVALSSGDLDADGRVEVLATTQDGTIECFDASGKASWSFPTGVDRPRVEVVDLEGDPAPEVLVSTLEGAMSLKSDGSMKRHYPGVQPVITLALSELRRGIVAASPGELRCVSPENVEYWVLQLPGEIVGEPRAIDLDGDGATELLVQTEDALTCLALDGRLMWREELPKEASWIAIDGEGDGGRDILVVGDGAVSLWLGAGTRLGKPLALSGRPARNLRIGERLFVYQRRPAKGLLWDPASKLDLESFDMDGDWLGGPPVWDPDLKRLLLPSPGRLQAWSPGTPTAYEALSQPSLGGVTLTPRLLLAGQERRLMAFDRKTLRPQWGTPPMPGRIEAPPLPLDLDGDGEVDRILFATSGSLLLLADTEGKLLAKLESGPVRYALQPLAPRATNKVLPVLLAAQSGFLLRVDVSPTGLRETARWELGHPPSVPPLVLRGNGSPRAIYVGTWGSRLHAVKPDLSEAAWCEWAPAIGNPCAAVLHDLDGDGAEELAVGWFSGQSSAIHIYSPADGTALACLYAGKLPITLAPGPAATLLAAGDRLQRWGPWPRWTPAHRPTEARILANLTGGAWSHVRKDAPSLRTARVQLFDAIAAWHVRDEKPIADLVRRKREWVGQQVQTTMAAFQTTGQWAAAKRVGEPFGRKPQQGAHPPSPPLGQRRVEGSPLVDFSQDPVLLRGFTDLRIAGGSMPRVRTEGIYLQSSATVSLPFQLKKRSRLVLHIEHRSLRGDRPGDSLLQVVLAGRRVVICNPPWWRTAPEVFQIGAYDAGQHTLELKVGKSTPTLYALKALRLEAIPE